MENGPIARNWPTTYSAGGLVCTVDHLASAAGAQILAVGGSAADAAIAANAVLAVTSPHLCGMGGDLYALVHHVSGPPEALDAAGRAGSGADPDRLRADGHTSMPMLSDVRSVTVPGCVDGWVALHERHGRLPFADVLAPARRLAEEGFPASPLLAFMAATLNDVDGCDELTTIAPDTGDRVVRPELARTLAEVADGGRAAFYEGRFGAGLLEVGAGEFDAADLARVAARWVDPLGLRVWGHDVWTMPPSSQGYLALAASRIAELVTDGEMPSPEDPAWVHLLVECSRLAANDRLAVLHDGAYGAALLAPDRLADLAARFDPHGLSGAGSPVRTGDTTYLCVVDAEGMGVSLIQSNAKDFGCRLAVPGTGILLHNRGNGFSLEPGHPAEYGPGRQPPHTLSPALVTRPDGSLRAVLGSMGGDSQPQLVTQMLARMLVAGQEAGDVVLAPRFVLSRQGGTGFDTWVAPEEQQIRIEGHAPTGWGPGLIERGQRVEVAGFDPAGFGHAHAIEFRDDAIRAGGADIRSMTAAAIPTV
jgi:gamma-glutamyltranspeptidase/glutathione hydrolase